MDPMKKTLLVLLGYGIGLGGLVLITYRTLLAVGAESKAITISVNRFGEQYLDLVCLVFLWVVCVVGLLSLSSLVRDGKNVFDRERDERNVGIRPGVSYHVSSDVLDGSARIVVGAVGGSLSTTGSGFSRVDSDGTADGFSYSVCVVQEATDE